MKKILLPLTCALGLLALAPSAQAEYRRTIMGYDSRGNPIIRVIWVADHLTYPRTIYARSVYDRRTYPTSLRRDPWTLVVPYEYSPMPVYRDPNYTYPER
jgi:hypothetical protein